MTNTKINHDLKKAGWLSWMFSQSAEFRHMLAANVGRQVLMADQGGGNGHDLLLYRADEVDRVVDEFWQNAGIDDEFESEVDSRKQTMAALFLIDFIEIEKIENDGWFASLETNDQLSILERHANCVVKSAMPTILFTNEELESIEIESGHVKEAILERGLARALSILKFAQ